MVLLCGRTPLRHPRSFWGLRRLWRFPGPPGAIPAGPCAQEVPGTPFSSLPGAPRKRTRWKPNGRTKAIWEVRRARFQGPRRLWRFPRPPGGPPRRGAGPCTQEVSGTPFWSLPGPPGAEPNESQTAVQRLSGDPAARFQGPRRLWRFPGPPGGPLRGGPARVRRRCPEHLFQVSPGRPGAEPNKSQTAVQKLSGGPAGPFSGPRQIPGTNHGHPSGAPPPGHPHRATPRAPPPGHPPRAPTPGHLPRAPSREPPGNPPGR